MKHLLLSTGMLAAAITLTAANQGEVVKLSDNIRVNQITNHVDKSAIRQLAPGVSLSTHHGGKHLHMAGREKANILIPNKLRKAPKAGAPEGYVLYESFEGWDGADINWTPDGWSVEMKGEVEKDESWKPSGQENYYPAVADGEYYFMINYGSDTQDEWLISPFVEVPEGMDLSYWLYLEPAYLYIIDSDHIDWDAYEFISKEVAATLQIWAQAEGEDWVLLRDYAEDYKDFTLGELASIYPAGLEKNEVPLDAFYGKNTRVAFRYVGYDGNFMFIDAIGIGYPALDDVAYSSPADTQFWGLISSPDMEALATPIAIFPVGQEIIWDNADVMSDVSYTWIYGNPDHYEGTLTSDDPYELAVTYHPDYSSEERTVLNLYDAPVLRAEAAHAAPTEFQGGYPLLQAGGRPNITAADGTEILPTMFPFNLQQLGLGITRVMDDRIGDMSIPVFGYNVNSDAYWLSYSFGGDASDAAPSDYSHLMAICNLIFPTNDAALVVNGLNIYGFGLISPDAELKAGIYGIGADYSTAYEDLTPIATATIKSSDIICQDPDYKSYMYLPFKFDEPAVVQATEEFPAYFVMFEGFNSDKVEYFAPLQSQQPHPDYVCLGYIVNHIDLSAQTGREAYYSTKPMCYIEDGEYIDLYGAFAFGLDAEYPWLTTDCDEIEFTTDAKEIEVSLGSYYDGSALTVDAPEGVTATVAGRYDKCVLSVALDDAAFDEGTVIVKGPGVEVEIPVKNSMSTSLQSIHATGAAIEAVYDLSGRRIIASEATPGIYMVKYTDGTTRKIVKR